MSVGVVAIDGTKVAANASREANRGYEQIARVILAEAAETDRREDELYGEARGDELPERLRTSEGRRAALREAKAKLEREAGKPPNTSNVQVNDNCRDMIDLPVSFVQEDRVSSAYWPVSSTYAWIHRPTCLWGAVRGGCRPGRCPENRPYGRWQANDAGVNHDRGGPSGGRSAHPNLRSERRRFCAAQCEETVPPSGDSESALDSAGSVALHGRQQRRVRCPFPVQRQRPQQR